MELITKRLIVSTAKSLPMNILPFEVCTVKSDISPHLGDHILGVVLHLLWSQDCQEDFQAGDWGVIQEDLEQ